MSAAPRKSPVKRNRFAAALKAAKSDLAKAVKSGEAARLIVAKSERDIPNLQATIRALENQMRGGAPQHAAVAPSARGDVPALLDVPEGAGSIPADQSAHQPAKAFNVLDLPGMNEEGWG
jgi:hypothetical protein